MATPTPKFPFDPKSSFDIIWKLITEEFPYWAAANKLHEDNVRARLGDAPGNLQAEVDRLNALLNTPETANFLEGVQREAAHQVVRWGPAHDRQKSAEHWFWLVGYLAGKALRAVLSGDREKAQHHTISSAAALLHWHTAISQDTTGCGRGRDADLQAHDDGRAAHERP